MKLHKLVFASLSVSMLVLAGCSGGGGGGDDDDDGPGVVKQEDQFGTRFGSLFRADANTEPSNVSEGDVVALSLTNESVAIN